MIKGLKIGDKRMKMINEMFGIKYPIIQGGMGVGVSLHRLAGTVSREGGIGVLSAADIGYLEPDFETNPKKANMRAIKTEIEKARKIAGPDKIIAANIMVAMTDYAGLVKEFVKQGIDLIISGAGLPLNLPEFIEGSKTKLIVKTWRRKYNYVPDMIVIEGPKAGGHLGFKRDELFAQDDKKLSLETITLEIVSFVRDLEKETGKEIPVIAAGGVFDGRDIQQFLSLGADGVQMATRFVATDECDASDAFKNAYVNASEEDIQIIDSPVGMPGRAIRNEFIKSKEDHKLSITKCYQCIKTCNVKDAPYCITKALINAVKGNLDEGLIFCGSNVGRVKEIVPVHDLIQELMSQCEAASVRTA